MVEVCHFAMSLFGDDESVRVVHFLASGGEGVGEGVGAGI